MTMKVNREQIETFAEVSYFIYFTHEIKTLNNFTQVSSRVDI